MGVRRKTAEEIEACVQQAVLEVQRLAVDGVAPQVQDYVALREDGPAVRRWRGMGCSIRTWWRWPG